MTQANRNGIPRLPEKKKKAAGGGSAGFSGKPRFCPLCTCLDKSSRHHLKPRSEGQLGIDNRENMLVICVPCHTFLHRRFDNQFLAEKLFTLELIAAHPDVQDHIAVRRVYVAKRESKAK